jgi:uncharacterized protein YbjT (DUF2867 family)
MRKTILITGGTGRQGGAVMQHLIKNNFNVKALTRTPESIAAIKLKAAGVEVVKGDMADISSLQQAMRGCEVVFSVQNYFEYGADKEILYGKNMADAALRSEVSHFIYSSVCNADSKTEVPHFETKNIIEQHIKKTGLPFTILRPVKFMENYYIPQVFRAILGGKLLDSIQAGKKHQVAALDDIGRFAADAVVNTHNYMNKTVDIAGDELSNEEIALIMSEVLGLKVKFSRLPLFIAKVVMEREMFLMFRWFNEKGFTANMIKTREEFPTVRTTSLKEFLVGENWQRWNKKGSI